MLKHSKYLLASIFFILLLYCVASASERKGDVVGCWEASVYIDDELLVTKYAVDADNKTTAQLTSVALDSESEVFFKLEDLARHLGYNIGWAEENEYMRFFNDKAWILITAWSSKCTMNGKYIDLHKPVILYDGFYYAPQSFLRDILGVETVSVEMAEGETKVEGVHLSTASQYVAVSYANHPNPLGRQVYTKSEDIEYILSLIPDMDYDSPYNYPQNGELEILVEVKDSDAPFDFSYTFYSNGLVTRPLPAMSASGESFISGVELVPEAFEELKSYIDYEYPDPMPDFGKASADINISMVDKNGGPVPNLFVNLELTGGLQGYQVGGESLTDSDGYVSREAFLTVSYDVVVSDRKLEDYQGSTLRYKMEFPVTAEHETNNFTFVWEYPTPQEIAEQEENKVTFVFTNKQDEPVKNLQIRLFEITANEMPPKRKQVPVRINLGYIYSNGKAYWSYPSHGQYTLYAYLYDKDADAYVSQNYTLSIRASDYGKEIKLVWNPVTA